MTEQSTTLEVVSFNSDGTRLAGNLRLPAGHDAGDRWPGVVVTGTWTSIKEQMADRYAALIAARGFAALSFDFTGFGASGGDPREVESARLKVADIRNAMTFLQSHPAVAADRLSVLSVCASAMYAAIVASSDARVRALGLVAPWIHDQRLVREVYGGEQGVRERITAARRATDLYARTGVVHYVPVVDAHNPEAAIPIEADFYTNPDRGAIPGWPNRFAAMAWQEWFTLDVIAIAPRIVTPTVIVHSRDAAIPAGAERFHQGLAGPKRLVWVPGTQFDFYDDGPTIGRALDHIVDHFNRYV